MPDRPRGPEHALEAALAALCSALDSTGAPWMVIGGVAVIARGVRRTTTDVDAVVRGDSTPVRSLLRVLAAHGIRPRIPRAAAFAQESLVLLLRHGPTGVDLDLSLGWSPFEHEALGSRTNAVFGRVRAPMATAEDLLVFKGVAGRGKDLDDAAALVTLYADVDLARVRRWLVELAMLADAPELVPRFEEAIRVVRPRRKPRRSRRSNPR